MKRFRWTRERYYRAQHLNRFLLHVRDTNRPPPLVQRLQDLFKAHPGAMGSDPLLEPVHRRKERRFGDDYIPF